MTERDAAKLTKKHIEARARVSTETLEAARASGLLPHEWLLAIMRGEQMNHFAYDSETEDIVEIIVLPTFTDRMEAAKACAPYFAVRMASNPNAGGPGGGSGTPRDPAKAPGVMHIPLCASIDDWMNAARKSQTKLKEDVTK